ncbi:hypothetical protein DSM104299_00820 [Baekduia alba]|uniref:hypothetical protein n=1 Tax=Baekduia alba TaxID=2997333 RepID=UPI002340399B|nr:hypothetical protein [Baekduia alba]WCB92135.1 hypothetical protein DSM104299_00820 [Baekduia alba]
MASGSPPQETTGGSSGIELTTLFLSAIASATAAYVTSKIWAAGTLFSAAMSPVIVALVKEGLRKPTEVVANVAAPSRWTRTGADEPGLVPDPGAIPAPADDAPVVDPDAPHVVLPPVVATEHSAVNVYSTRSSRLRWRVAVLTGLLGFVICVVVFTVPELIAGQSLGRHSDNATTIFGGRHRGHKTSTTSTTTTTTTSTTKSRTTPTTTTDQPAPSRATPAPSTATPAPSTAAPQATTTATPGSSSAPSSTAPATP